jgi:hypothetical protein
MVNEIKGYFETLEGLSAEELSESVEKLVCTEKRNVTFVIAHITLSGRGGRKGWRSIRLRKQKHVSLQSFRGARARARKSWASV